MLLAAASQGSVLGGFLRLLAGGRGPCRAFSVPCGSCLDAAVRGSRVGNGVFRMGTSWKSRAPATLLGGEGTAQSKLGVLTCPHLWPGRGKPDKSMSRSRTEIPRGNGRGRVGIGRIKVREDQGQSKVAISPHVVFGSQWRGE